MFEAKIDPLYSNEKKDERVVELLSRNLKDATAAVARVELAADRMAGGVPTSVIEPNQLLNPAAAQPPIASRIREHGSDLAALTQRIHAALDRIETAF